MSQTNRLNPNQQRAIIDWYFPSKQRLNDKFHPTNTMSDNQIESRESENQITRPKPTASVVIMFFFSFPQRTFFQPGSPTSTWALSSRWWNAPVRPPCCAPPAVTPTPRSPGTKTSCPSTPTQVTAESNSCAQVRTSTAPLACASVF